MLGKRSILGLVATSVLFLFVLYTLDTNQEITIEHLQATYEKSRTDSMNSKFDSHLAEYMNRELTRKLGVGDLHSFAQKINLYKKLHNLCCQENVCDLELKTLYKKLEVHLFSWATKKGDIDQFVSGSKGRGIVMTTGDNFAPLAANCIKALRLLGCNLPVEVFFHGGNDLSLKWVSYFNRIKNVKVVDVQRVFDMTNIEVPRWAIKSFAALGSSFTENIIIDADAVVLTDPEGLFEDEGYVRTGTLFFTDRTMWGYHSKNMTSFIESSLRAPPSDACKSTKIYRMLSNYQLKTGLMLIDKSRHLYGLLAACRLNSNPDSERLRTFVHSDKEMFWLGMELADEPYYFSPAPCGSIGISTTNEKTKKLQICGRQAHFDMQGELLWFGDGLCVNKGKSEFDLAKLTHIVKESSLGAEGYDSGCLMGDIQPLEGRALMNLQKISAIYEKDPLTV